MSDVQESKLPNSAARAVFDALNDNGALHALAMQRPDVTVPIIAAALQAPEQPKGTPERNIIPPGTPVDAIGVTVLYVNGKQTFDGNNYGHADEQQALAKAEYARIMAVLNRTEQANSEIARPHVAVGREFPNGEPAPLPTEHDLDDGRTIRWAPGGLIIDGDSGKGARKVATFVADPASKASQLLEAARTVFTEQGLERMTFADLCKAMPAALLPTARAREQLRTTIIRSGNRVGICYEDAQSVTVIR